MRVHLEPVVPLGQCRQCLLFLHNGCKGIIRSCVTFVVSRFASGWCLTLFQGVVSPALYLKGGAGLHDAPRCVQDYVHGSWPS